MTGRLVVTLLLGVAVVACTSPEASRQRGGGPGADVGNHREVVRLHEGADPYWRTPELLGKAQSGSIESARHADRLSRGQRAAGEAR